MKNMDALSKKDILLMVGGTILFFGIVTLITIFAL
jgi:hypothetical protein